MSTYQILYNPLSNNGQGEAEVKSLSNKLESNELIFNDITKIGDIKAFINSLGADEKIIITGGDGTLNHFLNDIDGMDIKTDVLFFATGSGNDFIASVGVAKGNLVPLNPFFGKLPTVTVNGKDYKFINGVGFGIDGYCCEVGDDMRATTDKPINYTSIAIKGLLFHFKPVNATVTVDGKTERFERVWLAPTMFGRFYGGGMIPTPDQKREDGTVSTMVYHGCGKLKALMVFPNIFKGEHVKEEKIVKIYKGHSVTVEFDKPTALQIDGET
ncbi:diacylglycerol/lipid kinase family protein, partial [Ruminococcus sp.]|uniref:diacylglycerol/lipid kinase family protein n=1 Tax=Ruminococcus sp. TaxID=41978 RepID=UPI003868BA29